MNWGIAMRIWMLLLTTISLAGAQTDVEEAAQAVEVTTVRVTGDRVSLRAEPHLEGYLLDRAMRGEELTYLGETNGWVAVQAPESLDFWVAGEYLQNGVVEPEKLNVRAGPSLNYPRVAVLSQGDVVALRGEFNEWLKIAPPEGSRVWISAEYAELIQPPPPEPVIEAAPMPQMVEEEVPEPAPETLSIPEKEEPAPLMLVLDKNREQGVYVEIPGILRRANPGLYKLVLIDGEFEEPICLVRGKQSQMERYLNRSMLIKGRRYWARDIELPVLQPERIHLDPLITD